MDKTKEITEIKRRLAAVEKLANAIVNAGKREHKGFADEIVDLNKMSVELKRELNTIKNHNAQLHDLIQKLNGSFLNHVNNNLCHKEQVLLYGTKR